MRPVSPAFLDTLRGSHQAFYRATVCTTFQTGVTPTGTQLDVMGGSITLDGNADLRSALDVTVDGEQAWPRFATDLLAPYGNEVYIEVGVLHSRVEFVGLGYHRIKTVGQDDPPDGPIRLECEDRMAAILQARLLTPQAFAAGTTLGTVVSTLVTDIYPAAVIEWDDATDLQTLARSVIVEEDRYGFLKDLVQSLGKIFYFDHRGVLVVKTLPDTTLPVFEVNHGHRGVLVSMNRHLTRDGVYNAVVATGEGGDTLTPAYGVATDDNPASPTYFLGQFGQVPKYYSSPFLATDLQAQQAAAGILRRQLGLPYVIKFGAVSNPALEPFDSVKVRYGNNAGPETHVLERLTIPLSESSPMTADTKEQTVTLIGTV